MSIFPTATVVRSTSWTEGFDYSFRTVVMDVCPLCRVAEAHATQYEDHPELDRCEVCTSRVILPVDGPAVNRVPEVGEYIGFAQAHPNNLYKVTEVGPDWVTIDFIGNMRSVDMADVRFHAPCENKWCNSCGTR